MAGALDQAHAPRDQADIRAMTHARKQIRDHVVTLVTGLATTGTNVSVGRVYPEGVTVTLPALNVLTDEESREDAVMGPSQRQGRNLTLAVEGRARGDAYLDTLDQIALEVETALAADSTFAGLAEHVEYDGMAIESSGELEDAIGTIVLTWIIQYRVDAQDPQ